MVERRGDEAADPPVVQVAQDASNHLSLFFENEPTLGRQSAEAIRPTPAVEDNGSGLSLFLDDEWTSGQQTSEALVLEEPADAGNAAGTLDTLDAGGPSIPYDSLDAELLQQQEMILEAASGSGLNLGQPRGEIATAKPADDDTVNEAEIVQEAQFQLPTPSTDGEAPKTQLPSRLVYEYGYGSESEITYRKNPDLDRSLQDDALIVTPELNAHVTYRPTDWLETTLEMILDREFPIKEKRFVTLPNGDVEVAENRQVSLLVDQAFVRVKNVTDPFDFTVGRLNFEDERHFVYDTSIDIAQIGLKYGKIHAQASVGRENLVDGDLLQDTRTDRINTYMFYTDYRGIEDIKLGAYSIFRDDKNNEEGQPWHLGVRSQGLLSNEFTYWVDLAHMRGSDEMSRKFSAFAFDVGGTYRFTNLPYNPNITLGFALATGDSDPDDNKNNEFRQTGLHSNETKFGGVSEFLIYGEALDPELSNLKILTAGLGFRPAPNMSVDFVFHKYWLYEMAEELRNSGITALMNQDPNRMSKDVGTAFDVVLGFRSLFGIRRLGMDLRTGWFFPGDAFRNQDTGGNFSDANKGISLVTKFWW